MVLFVKMRAICWYWACFSRRFTTCSCTYLVVATLNWKIRYDSTTHQPFEPHKKFIFKIISVYTVNAEDGLKGTSIHPFSKSATTKMYYVAASLPLRIKFLIEDELKRT